MSYDDLQAPIQGCEKRISHTESRLAGLESKVASLDGLLKLHMDRLTDDKKELREQLIALMVKLDSLADADLLLSKALIKSEAQWSLTRWFVGATMVIMLPFLSFTVPIVLKSIVVPAEAHQGNTTKEDKNSNNLNLHPTIKSYGNK